MSRSCSLPPADASCRRVSAVHRIVADLAASTWPRPTLVVVVFDDNGLLATARDHAGIGLADIEDDCAAVVEISPPAGLGTAVVLSFDPGLGTEPTDSTRRVFRD